MELGDHVTCQSSARGGHRGKWKTSRGSDQPMEKLDVTDEHIPDTSSKSILNFFANWLTFDNIGIKDFQKKWFLNQ